MKSKNGRRSLYPGWTITTAVLTSAAVGVAIHQLLEPRAPSAQELRQLAAAFLILGFTVFWLVTIIDGLIDTIREMREAQRAADTYACKLAEALMERDRCDRVGLPEGLCGNREEHQPHRHESRSLGAFWCTADESQRLPFAAERRRQERS